MEGCIIAALVLYILYLRGERAADSRQIDELFQRIWELEKDDD